MHSSDLISDSQAIQETKELQETLQAITNNLQSCIIGKEVEIRLLLTALLAEGHVLLEDVPGTGKTVLVKALAKSIQGRFQRIQCNPDLLPTDITGVSIYHPKKETFVFRPGPVMANVLLVDEINRATTKTQSALLEAMEEHHVSIDGFSHPLPSPFMMLATQNPVDFEGTYVLPEAQMDRFMLKFSLGYPDEQTEIEMIRLHADQTPLDKLESVADIEQIRKMQSKVRAVHVDDDVTRYAIQIVRKTREDEMIFLGASPRASLHLVHAAKAYAFLHGRDYVLPDDIKTLAPFVLKHRLLMRSEAQLAGQTTDSIIDAIIKQVDVPIKVGSR